MRILFLVTTALIVYGSLYPFNFVAWDVVDSEGFARLTDFSPGGSGIADLVQNILLFVPFGFFGMQLLPGLTRWQRACVVLLVGFNVGFGVQVAQLWLPSRIAAGTDAFWNMLGCAVGCSIGAIPFAQKIARATDPAWRPPIALILALAWMSYQWAPFVPSLDVGLLWVQLKSLMVRPSISLLWTFQGVVTWLVIFHFLDSSNLRRISRRQYPLIAAGVVVLGLFVVGNTLKQDRIVGVLLAAPVWWLLPARGRSALLACLMVLLIAGIKLESLDLREAPGSFSWIPFSGAMGGNMMINVLATYKKLILYGSLIWLLVQAGVRLPAATMATSALVFVTEYSQIFFMGTTPEVTDTVLAAGMGIAFTLYRNNTTSSAMSGPKSPGSDEARHSSRPLPTTGLMIAIGLLVAVGGTAILLAERDPVVRAPAWANFPASVIIDSHTHTRFSDGSLTPLELVQLAVNNGCDALAITDHSDGKGASESQLEEIRKLRLFFPSLLLFSGVELNIPSYGGREHLNLIVTPEAETIYLRSIADMAEDSSTRDPREGRDADAALARRIGAIPDSQNSVFTTYNHPSRKVSRLDESTSDIQKWRGYGLDINAFAGAPGHQRSATIGSYRTKHLPIDRWDPLAGEIGGGWDKLLDRGHDIGGALAVSDYHNEKLDAPPCGFARTHVSVPANSYEGVIAGLRQGTFWADHGMLLESLALRVQTDSQTRAAAPGAKVDMNSADPLAFYSVALARGSGAIDRPLTLELISNCRTGEVEQLVQIDLGSRESEATGVLPIYKAGADNKSCYLRARVRLVDPEGPDLLAYTNPIRFYL